MAENSKIEWTDHTFNPWIGCTKVGPGCDHCYAENMMDTRMGRVSWGAGNPRQRTSEANWRKPLIWNNKQWYECADCGDRHEEWHNLNCPSCDSLNVKPTRMRVFCASLADVFDNEVPIEWLIDLLDLIHKTPNLDWLLLTKRVGNVISRLTRAADTGSINGKEIVWIDQWWQHKRPPSNVWLGITVVNQEEAYRDIPKFLRIPATIRFLSMEPLISSVNLETIKYWRDCYTDDYGHGSQLVSVLYGIDWVIAGGESGPNARPSHPDWYRSLRDQCAAAGVPFLFKQWGEWMPGKDAHQLGIIPKQHHHPWGRCQPPMALAGKKLAGRLLDGVEHNGFPA